jgi:hypoxanthine phosphoribosyltransferase
LLAQAGKTVEGAGRGRGHVPTAPDPAGPASVLGLTTLLPFSIFMPAERKAMGNKKHCLIAKEEIARRVKELAELIDRDYAGRDLVMIGVLKGAFIFLADLVRELNFPVEIDFVRLRSYGGGTSPTGEVYITKDVELPLKDRDVLIVEDIMDIGFTLSFLQQHLATHKPRSLKICCLIDKRERREIGVPLDYVGFTVEKGFLVGYGLDCGEKGRTLPEVFVLEKD